MYCRRGEREGLKKIRATTSQAFWAAGNRRSGACANSRVHCLPYPHGTQPRDYDDLTRAEKVCVAKWRTRIQPAPLLNAWRAEDQNVIRAITPHESCESFSSHQSCYSQSWIYMILAARPASVWLFPGTQKGVSFSYAPIRTAHLHLSRDCQRNPYE